MQQRRSFFSEKFGRGYVDNITFLGDWKIIFKTVGTVLKREGISAANDATMPEFMGSTVTNMGERKNGLV